MEEEILYKSIDKNLCKYPCVYCKAKKGYLTPKLMKVHQCNVKHCPSMVKLDCQYWQDKELKKRLKKEKKR